MIPEQDAGNLKKKKTKNVESAVLMSRAIKIESAVQSAAWLFYFIDWYARDRNN